MSLLRNAAGNFVNFIKGLIIKRFVKEVTLSGIHHNIPKQLRKWKKTFDKNPLILESYFHKGKGRRSTYEIFWYVKNTKFMRWCGLEDYEYVRHDVNQKNESRTDSKRQTLRSI